MPNKWSDFLLVLVGKLHFFVNGRPIFVSWFILLPQLFFSLRIKKKKKVAVLCSCNVGFVPLGGTRSTLSTKSTVFHTGAAPHGSPRPRTTGEWTEKVFSLGYKHKLMLVTHILMCLHLAARLFDFTWFRFGIWCASSQLLMFPCHLRK